MHAQPKNEAPFSASWVARNYGAMVPTGSLALLLGFPTTAALRRAIASGRLSIPLFRVVGRRGMFADAVDVASYLRSGKRLIVQGGDACPR